MIPMALLMGLGFLIAFLYGVSDGQFDDAETPAHRILKNENPTLGKD
jgi:cbb3-type cytochrome oxidase maturation protein